MHRRTQNLHVNGFRATQRICKFYNVSTRPSYSRVRGVNYSIYSNNYSTTQLLDEVKISV